MKKDNPVVSVRLDPDLLRMIDEYSAITKDLFGTSSVRSATLEACIEMGFGDLLARLEFITKATLVKLEEGEQFNISSGIKERLALLQGDYAEYRSDRA